MKQLLKTPPAKYNNLASDTAWVPQSSVVNNAKETAPDSRISGIQKPPRPLTSKQKLFVKHIIDNPKASATAAAQAAYNTTTNGSARMIASDNLTKPNIIIELSKYGSSAELAQIRLMDTADKFSQIGGRDGASYGQVLLGVTNSILDRLHGKATTRVEQQSTVVTLNVDLTGMLTDDNV